MVKHLMDNGLIIICMAMVNGCSPMEEKKKEFGPMEIELDGWMMIRMSCKQGKP